MGKVEPHPPGKVVQAGGDGTGRVTAAKAPFGLRIRLRSLWRFFAAALFF